MNLNYTDEQIKKALERCEQQKKTANKYYKNRYATDEEFRENHKAQSRANYVKNKEKIQEKYQIEKKFKCAQRKYIYWKDKNNLEEYKKRYPEEWDSYFKDL